jgi:DNA-binding NtrC family response regulator
MTIRRFFQNLFPAKKERDPNVKSILIVDDDDALRDNMADILQGEGYETFCAATSAEASKLVREVEPWVALVDIQLPDGTGTALLSDLKNVKPDCVCIIITAHADVDSAVIAIEKGAFYYLRKPVKPDELLEIIELAFETIRVKEEKRQAEQDLKSRNRELEDLIARLKKMIE